MRAMAIVVLALAASPAFAQEGMYVGLGFGGFDYEENAAFLAPSPFEGTVSSLKVYGGFEFNPNFGFEIRYGVTDEIGQNFSGTDPLAGDFSGRIGIDFTTTSAVAMGFLPKDWGALFGGIGYFSSDSDAALQLTADCCGTINDSISVSDEGLMALLGIEWRFGRFGTGVGIRLEYEWLDVDAASGSTLGIGVAYRF